MTIIPFEVKHLAQMDLQERQRRTLAHMTAERRAVLAKGGPAVSAVVEGRIIASGGLVMLPAGAAFAWVAFAKDAGPYFPKLYRAARRFLADAPAIERLEAVTEVDFAPGHRWLELLGFKRDGILEHDGINGENQYRYTRQEGCRHGPIQQAL